MLKIEKLSEFARVDGISSRLSAVVYIVGLSWRIWANSEYARLGFFLQCNAGYNDHNWTCLATLRIVSQKEGEKDHTRETSHIFHSGGNDWGFPKFMPFKKLMDPNNGWYDTKNDTVTLKAEVTADKPIGVK
uniref:MATH domain-containing protein n=1 Tax=Globodera rostochiensis TaxID=31243 RepID=A0A914I0X2_GLORO